jgi:DNA-binding MarR family transcriptional regulator
MPSIAPASSPACACGRLRRATRALTQLYDDLMAPSGLRVTQFSLLRTLGREGSSPMSDLAETLLLDRTALSRTLDPLVARGLIDVIPGEDARTRIVSITRAGEKAVRAAQPHWARAQAQVTHKLGRAKLDALIDTLGEVEALHPDPGGRDR